MKRVVLLTLLLLMSFFSDAHAAVSPMSPSTASSVVSSPGAPTPAYLQSIKTLQENQYGENEIKSFVYHIFSIFDRHPDVNQLLLIFADDDLDMRVPEGAIKSHADLKKWYANIGSRYQSNLYSIENLEVSTPSKGNYRVSLIVTWQALGRDGKYVNLKFKQTWKIVDGGDYWPRIVSYVVEPAI